MSTTSRNERSVVTQVTAELGTCLGNVSPDQLREAVQLIHTTSGRVFLAGAGRSGLGIRGFAMRLMHLGRAVSVVGDTTTPAITRDDLLVIGSGSGQTASLRAMAEKAERIGARILLFTIAPDSPIAQRADLVVVIPASSPKVESSGSAGAGASLQPMGSLFEQALFILFDCVILLLMEREGLTSEQMFKRHANLE